jgi:hypothetical protein
VLHALQELRSAIDDRLRGELGPSFERHSAQSIGSDKLTVTFVIRADSPADAIRGAGVAAAALVEILTQTTTAIDVSGLALVVRAQ